MQRQRASGCAGGVLGGRLRPLEDAGSTAFHVNAPRPSGALVSERHSSTGRMMVNTITSLNELAQNEPKDSITPTASAPSSAPG